MSTRLWPEREQKFEVGDRVYEVMAHFGPDGRRILGSVVCVYLMGTMYHYVVKFDDDKESVLFDFEMIAT
jgi:hypothetical protein